MNPKRTLFLLFTGLSAYAFGQYGGGHPFMVEGPNSIQLVDLTNDGAPELLIGTRAGLLVHVNQGQSFGPAQNWNTTDVVGHATDVDGDGWIDVVGSNEQGGAISWYRNLGTFGLGPVQRYSDWKFVYTPQAAGESAGRQP